MAVRKNRRGITVTGADIADLKAALRKISSPPRLPEGSIKDARDKRGCPACGDYGFLGVRDELCACTKGEWHG